MHCSAFTCSRRGSKVPVHSLEAKTAEKVATAVKFLRNTLRYRLNVQPTAIAVRQCMQRNTLLIVIGKAKHHYTTINTVSTTAIQFLIVPSSTAVDTSKKQNTRVLPLLCLIIDSTGVLLIDTNFMCA